MSNTRINRNDMPPSSKIESEPKPQISQRGMSVLREILIALVVALVLFLLVRSAAQSFKVEGISMEPNMHGGQFIIVNKAAYRFGHPKRGDIVVFHSPRLNRGVIHRIVGLPGETVEIRQGEVYIDDQKLPEPYVQGTAVSVSRQQLPDDEYLIVGDNREASAVDIVPRHDIVGKAWSCFWPLSRLGTVPNYSDYQYVPT